MLEYPQFGRCIQQKHFKISHVVVSDILRDMGYSLQANKKTNEGDKHADRNRQSEYINDTSKKYILFENPVISIDTKKKEQIGNYMDNGKIICKKKNPIEVNVYDFETTKASNSSARNIFLQTRVNKHDTIFHRKYFLL